MELQKATQDIAKRKLKDTEIFWAVLLQNRRTGEWQFDGKLELSRTQARDTIRFLREIKARGNHRIVRVEIPGVQGTY